MPALATRPLLTATQAQIRSGRSMTRFRQWVSSGRLQFKTDEFGRRRFDPEDIDRLVAEVERYALNEATPSGPGADVSPLGQYAIGVLDRWQQLAGAGRG
jgi:hypothetical protein